MLLKYKMTVLVFEKTTQTTLQQEPLLSFMVTFKVGYFVDLTSLRNGEVSFCLIYPGAVRSSSTWWCSFTAGSSRSTWMVQGGKALRPAALSEALCRRLARARQHPRQHPRQWPVSGWVPRGTALARPLPGSAEPPRAARRALRRRRSRAGAVPMPRRHWPGTAQALYGLHALALLLYTARP